MRQELKQRTVTIAIAVGEQLLLTDKTIIALVA